MKIWLLGYLKLVFTVLARGEGERSWQLLTEAEDLAHQAHFARGIAWAEQERVHLCAMQGDLAPLLTWLQACGLDPTKEPDIRQEDVYHLVAQAFLARQEPERALTVLHRLWTRAEQMHRTGLKIPLLLSMARVYQLRGENDQALAALAQALVLAEPQGYMRTFLDEGATIMPLLNRLYVPSTQSSYSAGYLKRLLRALRTDPILQRDQRQHASPLTEQLSQRELEVLSLLAAGCSNAEIAEALIIGLNTVKTHLKNIYGKLEVSTRTQAVARAHALQLL